MHHNIEFIAFGLRAVFAALCVIFAWQVVYLPTAIDTFRQRIFCIRRELFAFMASGAIEPYHPVYTMLRMRMNAMLRFADSMQLSRMIIIGSLARKRSAEIAEESKRRYAMITDETLLTKLKKFDCEIGCQLLIHFLRTSPIMWAILITFCLPRAIFALLFERDQSPKGGLIRSSQNKIERRLIYTIEAESEELAPGRVRNSELVGA